ncbi:MAG TPA: polysaccharide lyase 6 family protein [Ktedonobacteraceae bacterium]|nr:polysaccharide lyase 6 family protein [Ktedonobacteraceae bacterium]
MKRLTFILTSLIITSVFVFVGSAAFAASDSVTSHQAASSICLRTVTVTSGAALAGAATSALPGDCIVVANGSYTGLTLGRSGTAAHPIMFEAQNLLQATFTSSVVLTGSYVTLQGFHFGGSGNVRFSSTTGSRVTRCLFNSTKGGHFIELAGNGNNGNRIDHSELGPQTQPAVSEIFVGGGSLVAQNTQIDHNYFHDVKPGPNNTNTIQLGISSAFQFQNEHSIVEYNLFVRCSGENEMIEVKSGMNIVRYNTMHANSGYISLREGNANTVYGNFVFGDGVVGAGGIRMWGNDHVIYNNYIDSHDTALELGSGDPHPVPTSHFPLIRPTIVNNTFISESTSAVTLSNVRPVAPDHMIFANNIAIDGHGTVMNFQVKPTNSTYADNIVHPLAGATAGVTATPGQWLIEDPRLVADSAGVQEPVTGSPAIRAGSSANSSLVTDDVFGRARPSSPTIGAVEFGSGGTRHPLTTADVGPASP